VSVRDTLALRQRITNPTPRTLAGTRGNPWPRQGAGAACNKDTTMKTSSGHKKAQMRFTSQVAMGNRSLLSRKLSLVVLILLASATWSLPPFVLTSASAAEPKTLVVTTGALQMTGLGGGTAAVRLTSGVLQMTGMGMGATEVRLTSGALQMTGLGVGATEVRLTSGALQMTGLGGGAAAVRLTSGVLQMTGLGMGAATVSMTTEELRMTGFGL